MPDFDLVITSGVGPAEARRFTFQLAGHLEEVALARGLVVRDVVLHGDARDTVPRSAVIVVSGDAPAVLADELGTHVLVARSDRRGRSSRKRWFVAVTLQPHVAAGPIAPVTVGDDIVVTACRAGGPGGQHVNKTASAVRVEHVPTGLTVRSSAERSQHRNLAHALRRLAALLHEREHDRRADSIAARRRTHYGLERGRAIRSYTLDDAGALRQSPP